jgi:HAD superfamily hydrolase (TIGR01509 family)
MAVLFDLDQTLIDSARAEPFRKSRQWSVVYAMIPDLKPYPGISDLLERLVINKIPIGIVTSSPRPYLSRVIKQWGWNISVTVCYHDTKLHKPHPEPIQLALNNLGVRPDTAVSIGDRAIDIIASRRARVYAIGVTWGVDGKQDLLRVQPNIVCDSVSNLETHLKKKLGIPST